jgi:hypothetical protein
MENTYDLNVPKIDLPNATVVVVLGIASIVGCCCYGIVGTVCSITALVMAKSATDLYVSEPAKYTESSYKNMNAGKSCAWIGLILSVIHLLSYVWVILTFGFTALIDPSVIFEHFGVQPPF